MYVVHRIQSAYRVTCVKDAPSRNAYIRYLSRLIAQELKPRVAKRHVPYITPQPYVNVAHRRHSDQLTQRAKILGRDRPQDLFCADEPRRLAVGTRDVEAVMKPRRVFCGRDFFAYFAPRPPHLPGCLRPVIKPARGAANSELRRP